MNGSEKKNGNWKLIMGGLVLIIVLFAGIKFVFWGLEQAIPKSQAGVPSGASVSQNVSGEPDAPSFCVHCGKALPESFRWGQFCPYCGKQVV